MSQVIANPEAIRQFADALKLYIKDVEDETERISAQFNQLGASWQDAQHQKFENDFNELRARMAAFKENVEEHPKHLYTLAEDLEIYHGR